MDGRDAVAGLDVDDRVLADETREATAAAAAAPRVSFASLGRSRPNDAKVNFPAVANNPPASPPEATPGPGRASPPPPDHRDDADGALDPRPKPPPDSRPASASDAEHHNKHRTLSDS